MTTYVLTHLDRPWTQNQERALHHHRKAAKVKEWRQAFRVLAIQAHLPRLERVAVTAQSQLTFLAPLLGADRDALELRIEVL